MNKKEVSSELIERIYFAHLHFDGKLEFPDYEERVIWRGDIPTIADRYVKEKPFILSVADERDKNTRQNLFIMRLSGGHLFLVFGYGWSCPFEWNLCGSEEEAFNKFFQLLLDKFSVQ